MPTQTSQLVSLLARVAEHDNAAFAALYDASAAKLYAVALRILRDRDLADDIVQDVFVKIWNKAGDFNPEIASPITWMATITRNRALDEVRRRGARVFVGDAVLDGLESDDVPALALLERQEDVDKLKRCLEGLEVEKRKMVRLAYLDGMSREELAEKFDRPEGTIKTWLRRSLMQLKGCLDE